MDIIGSVWDYAFSYDGFVGGGHGYEAEDSFTVEIDSTDVSATLVNRGAVAAGTTAEIVRHSIMQGPNHVGTDVVDASVTYTMGATTGLNSHKLFVWKHAITVSPRVHWHVPSLESPN